MNKTIDELASTIKLLEEVLFDAHTDVKKEVEALLDKTAEAYLKAIVNKKH